MSRKYPEEDYARDLHQQMVHRFPQLSPTASGMGVHWHCEIAQADRSCRIDCFTELRGPQYLTAYQVGEQRVAYSRTAASEPLLSAVATWLEGATLAAMYDYFDFIDTLKRRLMQIQEKVLDAEPALQCSAESALIQSFGDIYALTFEGANRACEITFFAKNRWPDAKFSWDDCQLFQYQPQDMSQFASLLKCWLCDGLMPSAMRAQFPWLTIGELADFYEAGNPVEGEFLRSWDRMLQFYEDSRCPCASEIQTLMQAMRKRGYDKTLRAGQSLWTLILSRSRRHGMRDEQPWIQFFFHDNGMKVRNYLDNPYQATEITFASITYTDQLEALLDQLQSLPVD